MTFNPKKSELLHFTRGKAATDKVYLLRPREEGLIPVPSVRFLKVWLNSKLSFKVYGK